MDNQYAYNKRAKFDYQLLDKYEAGIKLRGYEVKSIKNKTASLQGSFVIIRGGEAYITNMQVPPYQEMNIPGDYDASRPRKLLLHKKEIEELERKLQQKGLTLVPIKLYNKGGLVKLEFALAKGKKKADKRETIKKREDDRKMRRSLKN
ncbi:MAG: SsrA-binding protein SmpB [Candidatus Spechtbacterales bacterium]|nr:SsrA-binding protein SmpB [Candidatus Spechtbacterales bacterium]